MAKFRDGFLWAPLPLLHRSVASEGTGQTVALSLRRRKAQGSFAKSPVCGTHWRTTNLSMLGAERDGTDDDDKSKDAMKTLVGVLARVRIVIDKIGVALGFKASAEQRSLASRLRAYGAAAVISYGLFDALTYSLSFLVALRGFTASTGKALSRETFPQVFALCWGINNFSRPFRLAGALLLAPTIDARVVQPIKNLAQRRSKSRAPPPSND
uniref:Uncharacterized protein n=1 Tax=Compsopogon caeruleus TaxID=31354 RepID=A0A6T6BP60_9RHOD|mmetsp:Transcript_16872/g.34954  ORF Transcript_16872/g.34954 Transcript_16872/m.34954 type:complete len:212 (+) Transcript_16872:173-808(+)